VTQLRILVTAAGITTTVITTVETITMAAVITTGVTTRTRATVTLTILATIATDTTHPTRSRLPQQRSRKRIT